MDELTEKEAEVLEATAAVWNKFLELSEGHTDDLPDVKFHIHAIQRILYTRLYIRKYGQL